MGVFDPGTATASPPDHLGSPAGRNAAEPVAKSRAMAEILAVCQKLARINARHILIRGESGTGKGVVARHLHTINPGLPGPFIPVDCAAFPENLLEAMLFGTCDPEHQGVFETARNGTLFLENINTLPLPLQTKLMHCLESGECYPVGRLSPVKVNCNAIFSTRRDLAVQVALNRFRKDLYFTLNAFSIGLPPLRKRREDIPELSLHFLNRYNARYGKSCRIPASELQELQADPFPGNIRELKSRLKQAVAMAEGSCLTGLAGRHPSRAGGTGRITAQIDIRRETFSQAVAKVEKQILLAALKTCKSTRELAACLGMSQSRVVRKLSRYGLNTLLGKNR